MKSRTQRGFTLIEVLIAMGIIGILTAVALPSYKSYIQKANRSAAQSFMLHIANKQEQFLLDKRNYFCTAGCLNVASPYTLPTEVARNYTFTVTASDTDTPRTFSISAIPIATSSQASDTKCATLTYTSTQVKGQTGTGSVSECW